MIFAELTLNNFHCSSDYLKIVDEKNVKIRQFCGDLTGKYSLVDADGDYLVVTFHSNGVVEKRGFVVTFTATQPCKYSYKQRWRNNMPIHSKVLLFYELAERKRALHFAVSLHYTKDQTMHSTNLQITNFYNLIIFSVITYDVSIFITT